MGGVCGHVGQVGLHLQHIGHDDAQLLVDCEELQVWGWGVCKHSVVELLTHYSYCVCPTASAQ